MISRSIRVNSLGLFALFCAACASSVSPGDGGADVPASPDVPIVDLPDVQPDVPLPDAPLSCSFAGASDVRISLMGPSNVPMDCSSPRPSMPGGPGTIVTRTARVVEVHDDETGAHVTLDYCSPGSDCIPMIGSLAIQANGFNLSSGPIGLRPGQFLQIRSRASWSWGCTMQIEISNAPTWDDVPNPVRGDAIVVAAAASGEPQALSDAPFGVAPQSIGCRMPGQNCGAPAELFALAFQGSCNDCLRNPDPVIVYQGTSGVFGVNGTSYTARNARSFNTGACDDYWNYAWTVREVWLE